MTRVGSDNRLPSAYHVPWYTFILMLLSIVLHVADVYYDYYISFFEYLKSEKYAYFIWTIVFVIVSSIIIASISIRMYVDDSKQNFESGFRCRILLNVVGALFQVGPVIRTIDSFKYAIKSRIGESEDDKKTYFTKMTREDSDLVILKIFECYLESAPQLVLQISIKLIEYSYHSENVLSQQTVMIILTFLSLAFSMTNYQRCIRMDQDDRKNISFLGLLTMFFWHLNITVSRILALTALVSINPLMASFIVVHWLGMTIWLVLKRRTKFFGEKLLSEVYFSGAVGLVYIFNFISFKDTPTRNIYIVFYGICFIENISMSLIWGFNSYLQDKDWVYYLFLVAPTCTFVLGVIFMIIYYKFLHPTLST